MLEWIEKLKIEDIPFKYKEIAEKIGIIDFMKLCGKFGNETIHITAPQRLKSRIRKRIILNEYNGSNAEELAEKYEITTEYINVLVKNIKINPENKDRINIVPKNINEWLELLQPEKDLTTKENIIIDTIGMDKYIILFKWLGGKDYYFPIQEKVIKSKIDKNMPLLDMEHLIKRAEQCNISKDKIDKFVELRNKYIESKLKNNN